MLKYIFNLLKLNLIFNTCSWFKTSQTFKRYSAVCDDDVTTACVGTFKNNFVNYSGFKNKKIEFITQN